MKRLFVPITKVDVKQRLVYGAAAVEEVDKAKEIFDYDSSKPLFEAWSAEAHKFSNGKSYGNVRAMHGKVAAGRLDQITFNDDDKIIEVAAKIVDDNEWEKVEEGVYTGFSIGGSYEKRWKDGDCTRYTAAPAEVSIVDNPCQPSARFTMTKADGSTEERPFASVIKEEGQMAATNDQVAARARELAKAAGDETKWASFVEKAREELDPPSDPATGEPAAKAASTEVPAAHDGEGRDAAGKAKAKTKSPPVHGKGGGKAAGDEEEHGDNSEASVDGSEVDNKDNKGVDHAKAAGTPSNPDDGLSQVWKARDGQTFAKKADAVAHNEELDKAEPETLSSAVAALRDSVEKAEGRSAQAVEKFDGMRDVDGDGTDGLYWLAKKDYSEDKRKEMAANGEAMPGGGYPIKDRGDLKDAIQAFGRAKDKVATKKHIIARAKALGATDMLPEDWPGSTKKAKKDAEIAMAKALVKTLVGFEGRAKDADGLAKGMSTVARLANLVQDLEWLHQETKWEAAAEGDNSSLPQELKEDLANLCNTLKNMLAEESSELFNDEEMDVYGELLEAAHLPKGFDAVAKVLGEAAPKALEKAGARHSKADMKKVQMMHDTAVDLGADCGMASKASQAGDLEKVTKERDDLQKQVKDALPVIKELSDRLKKLEDQPMPRPGADESGRLRVVEKSEGAEALQGVELLADISKNNPGVLAEALIRMAQRNPQKMQPGR